MKLPRRRFLHLAAGAAALSAVPRAATAQIYPTRAVRIIIPWPAGQATDTVARLIGQSLAERLVQPFVMENRPGAGGNIGTEAVVRAPPDGYTLLLVNLSNAINTTLYKKLNFDLLRDIAPVASIGGGPYVMVINPSVPAKTVPEFIAYAKANPGAVNMQQRTLTDSAAPRASDTAVPGWEGKAPLAAPTRQAEPERLGWLFLSGTRKGG